jgi:SAM-dependent methyltransferase
MEPTERNLRAWEDAHRRREAEEPGLSERVLARLPNLEGRHVLHLGCGDGAHTIQLAQRGALVTGVDPDARALEIAQERGPAIAWVHAPLEDLPLELRRGRFDLAYTGEGALARAQDLSGWATGLSNALRPGGGLVLFDVHPSRRCLDGILHWREDYYAGELPGLGRLWRLGQIVMALVESDLRLRRLEELPGERAFTRFEQRVPSELVILAERKLK